MFIKQLFDRWIENELNLDKGELNPIQELKIGGGKLVVSLKWNDKVSYSTNRKKWMDEVNERISQEQIRQFFKKSS